eukprot:5185604-Karenia_brevis.AAC.1
MDEDEEEEFQECIDIPRLVSSEDEGIPNREDLERMKRITSGRIRRDKRTVFRETRAEPCAQ